MEAAPPEEAPRPPPPEVGVGASAVGAAGTRPPSPNGGGVDAGLSAKPPAEGSVDAGDNAGELLPVQGAAGVLVHNVPALLHACEPAEISDAHSLVQPVAIAATTVAVVHFSGAAAPLQMGSTKVEAVASGIETLEAPSTPHKPPSGCPVKVTKVQPASGGSGDCLLFRVVLCVELAAPAAASRGKGTCVSLAHCILL